MNLPFSAYQTNRGSEKAYFQKTGKSLPSAFSGGGFAFRLRPWEEVNPISTLMENGGIFDPPRLCHSDQMYALFTSKLVNFLRGDGRAWAMHEFFYSDLDRAW